jgi:2-dehydropantoate 2-reductase
MKIVIYGAGGIGSVVGGHLWRSGHEVILIGRAGHVRAINENGLKLITPKETYVLRIPAVTVPAQVNFNPGDVVFLTVKGQKTEEALRDLQAVNKDVPVFCLQNGVRNEEIAARYFPRIYGATFGIGAEYLTDGTVICRRDPPGRLLISRYPGGTDNLVEDVAVRLRDGGFFVKVILDVMPYKWGKLMGNLANAIDAITGSGGKDVAEIARAARQELTGLLEQAGIRWISQDELAKETPEVSMPPRPGGNTPMHSSTWQSLMRRQGSVETEFLNGEVVRLANRLGQSAPINLKLMQISQEMASSYEQPGKYTADQLRSILGL